MIGVAFFGGPFIWIMMLVTHLAFRRATRTDWQDHFAAGSTRAMEFVVRARCFDRGSDFHVVGAGFST